MNLGLKISGVAVMFAPLIIMGPGDAKELVYEAVEEPEPPPTLTIESLGPEHPFWYVSWCESERRQYEEDGSVLRGRVNPSDIGIMQINEEIHEKEIAQSGLDIYTEEGNLEFAMRLWKRDGLRHWKPSEHCWKPLLLSRL